MGKSLTLPSIRINGEKKNDMVGYKIGSVLWILDRISCIVDFEYLTDADIKVILTQKKAS